MYDSTMTIIVYAIVQTYRYSLIPQNNYGVCGLWLCYGYVVIVVLCGTGYDLCL
jgi:hypothetical protein